MCQLPRTATVWWRVTSLVVQLIPSVPPRSSRGCDPQKVWRCVSYVESPGDGSVLIRHEAVAERGRRYRRQVSGLVFTSPPSSFARRLDTASLKCLVLAFSLSHRFRPLALSRSQVTSPPMVRMRSIS